MSTIQPGRYEKKPAESKKFIAWALSEMSWKAILVVAFVQWKSDLTQIGAGPWGLLLSIVLTTGVIGVGFILGQSGLDIYVRLAEIGASHMGKRLGKPPADTDSPTDPGVQP